MAEPIQSPIAGSIRGIRTNVSSSIFTGRPVAPQRDTISDNIIAQNSLSLNNVSQTLTNISAQVGQLTLSLGIIKSNLAVQSKLDSDREAAKATRERKSILQGRREGKEGIIEKVMQNALVNPIRSLGRKAQFSLGKLANFFTILLTGWIGDKVIKAFRFLSSGNTVALNKLGRDVIGSLALLGAILLSFKLAFKGLLLTLGVIGLRIGRFGRTGVFTGPIRALGNMLTRASIAFLRGLKNPFRGVPFLGRLGSTSIGKPSTTSLVLGATGATGLSLGIDALSNKPLDESLQANAGGLGFLTVSSILTKGLAAGDWRSKALTFMINSFAFSQGYKQFDPAQNQKQTNESRVPTDGSVMPSMFSPITDQDLLNEIKLQKPERSEFVEGKSGTEEFEKALEDYNNKYGERIGELEQRISTTGGIKDIKTINSKKDMDVSSLGQLEELPPVFLPFPGSSGGEEKQQGGLKKGAATGYPSIDAVDPTNVHVYFAYKMFNISPAMS